MIAGEGQQEFTDMTFYDMQRGESSSLSYYPYQENKQAKPGCFVTE
jgi:hypothetical protein